MPERAEVVRLRLDGDAYVEVGRVRADDGPTAVDEPFAATIDAARLRP